MNTLKILATLATLVFASNASASWIWFEDIDTFDDAINPGPANEAPEGPDNQSALDVENWLEDLTNSSVDFLAQGNFTEDGTTPDILNGLDALGATYIVLHYGNYQGAIPTGFQLPIITQGQGTTETSNVNIAFVCDGLTSCDTFDPSNAGLSNYRIFGSGGTSVPEPGSLALLGLGAIALMLRRRQRR